MSKVKRQKLKDNYLLSPSFAASLTLFRAGQAGGLTTNYFWLRDAFIKENTETEPVVHFTNHPPPL